MALQNADVTVLQVKCNTFDEVTVLVHETAAVLTLRNMKLFHHTGDIYNRDHRPGNTDGRTRIDIFDVEKGATFVVSDFGVWDVNTSVLEGTTMTSSLSSLSISDIIPGLDESDLKRAENPAPKMRKVSDLDQAGGEPHRKKHTTMV